MRAGMDRKTGRRWLALDKLPSESRSPRTWRTREDPFAAVWPTLTAMLEAAPELQAKSLFEWLEREEPGRFLPGQLRTLQRKVRRWRAQHGPPKPIFFAQQHRPGEAIQTDFTVADSLGITIAGEPFPHRLCHSVLPYSNWSSVTVCRSESLPALRRGIQTCVFALGRVPTFHQTDNSTAATHNPADGGRAFNREYEDLMSHLGMKPRTTGIGEKEQNGDVESKNGVVKRRLDQHLLLRGSRDFASMETYEAWARRVIAAGNELVDERFREDLAAMTPLLVRRLPEYSVVKVRVSKWSTIRVKENAYSVPSRLRDEPVTVRVYDDRLEVYYADRLELTMERLLGKKGHRINYRHVIWSLVQKPGAFERYRYREDLFPTLTFRRAYDALASELAPRQADIEYLRVLHLASATMECEVEAALELVLEAGELPQSHIVKGLIRSDDPEIPAIPQPQVDLTDYDLLLG